MFGTALLVFGEWLNTRSSFRNSGKVILLKVVPFCALGFFWILLVAKSVHRKGLLLFQVSVDQK